MLTAYLTSIPGSPHGIGRIIAAIEEFPEQLLFVLRVHLDGDPPAYNFIAVFRESGSIGGFTALINQEGTTSGYSGGGPGGYAEIMSFIEERRLRMVDAYWRDWESDYPKFTQRIAELDRNDAYTGQQARVWSAFLSYYIWYHLPRSKYRPSREWDERVSKEDYIANELDDQHHDGTLG